MPWFVCALLLLPVSFAFAEPVLQRSNMVAEQRQQLTVVYTELQQSVQKDFDLSLLPKVRVLREQAKSIGETSILIDSLLLEGRMFQQYGAYRDALQLHHQALALAEKNNDMALLLSVYFAFIELEVDLERFDAALYYLTASERLIKVNQLDGESSVLHTLWKATVLHHKGSYHEVITLLASLLQLHQLQYPLQSKILLLNASAQLALGEFETARRALLGIGQPEQILSTKELIEYHILLATCHLQAGELFQAQLVAAKQLERTFDTRYLSEQGLLQQILASAYAQQQDYQHAHQYLQRALMTERGINLQKRSNKVLQLEAQYSLAAQKQQLNVLEKDNAEQAVQLIQQQQQIENVRLSQQRWILLVLLAVGVSGFLYWRWQNKRYLVMLKEQVKARTAELDERNERLQALSFTDSLTGLRNRHYFFSVIDSFINKESEQENILCLVDIDHFKRINDTYGHSAGDIILQKFAEILKQCTRKSDIVVRWGGEEFLLLMPNMTRQDACELVERIRLQVSSYPFVINDHILTCTCSMGFAPLPLVPERQKWLNWEQTLELADVGLYIAKETRRNAWLGIAGLADYQVYENAELITKQARTLIRTGILKVYTSHSQVMLNA